MKSYLESTAIDPKWIIDDSTPMEAPEVTGDGFGAKGFVPRDLTVQPLYEASPSSIKTYPMEDWPAMLEEQERKQSSLFHVRNRCGPNGGQMPFLSQGRFPYCHKHSAAHAIMLGRGVARQPYVALSAFSLDPSTRSGGWAAKNFQYAMEVGIAPQSVVPQGRDCVLTEAIKQASAPYKISEGWWDAATHPGLRKLTMQQLFTLLWDGIPCPVEFNWWRHSVLGLRFVDKKDRSDPEDIFRYALDYLNSWPGFGVDGVGRLQDSKMVPDSSVGLTVNSAA